MARIGGYNYFDTSGNLLDLLDISNVANGIDVSQYEGGILNITPVAMYSQTETVQLGLDVAQFNPGQFAGGYLEMMLESGGSFKLYEDLSYEMSVSTHGGLIAGDTADIFVTFAKDGEDTVQGQINVEYIDPAPVHDADLNQAFSENLYNGQSQVISSGQVDLEGQTSIEIYHVESGYSHTFDLLDSWQPWPYPITGTHGSLEINQDGSYQYYYQGPAAGVSSGSVTDTFDITVDAASDAADFNSAVPRTGTMTFTANHVAVPVTPPQQQQVFDIAIDDLNGDDLRVDYGNGQTPDTFDITVDPHDPGVLEFSKVTLQQSFVSDLISGLSNNSALDLEFKIDQMPAGAGTAYIELFVHDKGNGDFNDDHPGERSIGMIFEVEYDQYGMTIPTQTGIQVEYFGANATTPLTFSVDNLDPDTISLSNGTNSTPGSLNLKLGSILAKLDDSGAYSSSLLSDAGSYMVEISATTSLSGETATNLPLVYGAGNPVHEIRGEVEIVAGGSPVFTVITDDAESADLIINAGNGNQRSIDLYIDPSDSEVLKFSRVTLNDQFVKDQIDGLASNSALDLSFKLGALPTSGTGSAFIELTVQDKGNGNMSVESGERAISMVFEVDYDRDSISIPQQSGVEVSYKGAYGGIATFYVDNLDADTINLVQGTNSTPNSLNLKLGSILEKLDGSAVYSSSLLSDPGNYIVSLSGKSQIDGGVDVDLPIVDSYGNKIKSIVGEVEIIDPPSNVEFHYGGSSSNVTALTTTEDPFGKVTFDEFGVHDYVFTNYSLEPSIKFDLADAIATSVALE